MFKSKRVILKVGILLAIAWVIAVICVSPLIKFLIEKYDKPLMGREISVNWVYANPFTGYVYFNGLEVFEAESDSVFVSAEGLGVDFSWTKLLLSTYEFSEITLTDPRGLVLHTDSLFNFTDIIELFSPDTLNPLSADPVKFRVKNLRIVNGEFHYQNTEAEVNYFIKNVQLFSHGFGYDSDTVPFRFDLESGIGSGKIAADGSVNVKTLDFQGDFLVERLNLDIINQYLRPLTNYGVFAAQLDAALRCSGNFRDVQTLNTAGQLTVSDFHFGKSPEEDYASFKKLTISIQELNPSASIYRYDSFSLVEPFFRYERYDELDNVQTMFGVDGANLSAVNASDQFNLVIEIAKAVEQLSRNFFRSDYEVGRVAIYNGNFEFSDYSLSQQFHVSLHPFFAHADSLHRERERVQLYVESAIRPYGYLWGSLSVNPKDSSYFDLEYRIENVSLSMFNPYVYTYTSFPINRGSLAMAGKWNVNNSIIDSRNHLSLIDLRTAKKVKSKDTKWVPVPLALAFLREGGNFIDYEIPITGTLTDPSFNVKDVLLDLLENMFIKPMTTPYRMKVKNIEQQVEQSLSMQWAVHQATTNAVQNEFIGKMVEFLKQEPDASISIQPMMFEALEKESILMYAAKQDFMISTNQMALAAISFDDSLHTMRMSIKDSAFIRYLDKHTSDPNLFTAQHKAEKLISEGEVNDLYNQLVQQRQSAFLHLFIDAGVSERVVFLPAQNTVPFNGFSFFSISYAGDFPEYLREAVSKMNDMVNQNPRAHKPH